MSRSGIVLWYFLMNIRILILKAVINLEKHRIREGRCANCTIPNLHPSSPDASLIFIFLLELFIEALEELSILKFYLLGPQRRGGSWEVIFCEEQRKKWWGEQKKWLRGQFLLLLKTKIRRVKMQLWGRNAHFLPSFL